MLSKNQILDVTVDGQNNLGFGVAHIDGMAIFVSGAVMGDLARIRIIKTAKTWAAARTEQILTPSPHRCDSGCTAKGCGGCAYREIVYQEECRRKQSDVEFYFRKAGLCVQVDPVVTVGGIDGYRNKAQYAIGRDKDGAPVAGFFAPKSHRVVPAMECPLSPEVFHRAVKASVAYFKENALSVYDEQTGKGLLRHIYLRHSESENKVLYTLVINGSRLPDEEGFVAYLQGCVPEISGVLLNENREDTNVILGNRWRSLAGEKALTDVLCGVRLSIAPDAFFQVNRRAAEWLYEKGRELADLSGTELLWDLYCGAGSIGLSMAKHCRAVVGVEIVPSAVENARRNARENGIDNARFVVGDAGSPETLLQNAYDEAHTRPDVVVLDPPRKGCTRELLEYLADTVCVPRIVYISCAPDTLARDAGILAERGYSLSPVTPVNLFPRTGHVETIVCLNKQ